MPKMKTNKSVKKRIKVTATGKLMRRKANLGHLLSGKRQKRKRRLRRPGQVHATDMRRAKSLLAMN